MATTEVDPFRIAITRDLMAPDGTLLLDIGLDLIERVPGIEYEFLAQDVSELRAGQLRGYDALFLEAPRLSERSLDGADRLAIVARFGVGYDGVDVDACTANGTLLTITPDGVRRPMAVAAVTLVLSLSQWLVAKDRLVRDGRWDERGRYTGVGLEGRTLGAIGARQHRSGGDAAGRAARDAPSGVRPIRIRARRSRRRRRADRPGHSPGRVRLRARALLADYGNQGTSRRAATRVNEADRVSRQRCARSESSTKLPSREC